MPAVLSSTTPDAFLSRRFGFIEFDAHPARDRIRREPESMPTVWSARARQKGASVVSPRTRSGPIASAQKLYLLDYSENAGGTCGTLMNTTSTR